MTCCQLVSSLHDMEESWCCDRVPVVSAAEHDVEDFRVGTLRERLEWRKRGGKESSVR